MPIIIFQSPTGKDKTGAVERLISGSTPSQDFFLMIIFSVLTATFGLLLNNVAIIIGSMLIAPMLYPILSFSLGITMSDPLVISRSFYTIIKSLVFGIVFAALATLLFSSQFEGITPEIISRTHPTISYLVIAVIAGFAASFALVKPQLSETLPGIAISVALIPPIAVTGIGIAWLNWSIISGSLLLFMVNTLGVIFAGIITFSLMNFYVKRKKADEVVKKEDQKIKKEIRKAEKEKKN